MVGSWNSKGVVNGDPGKDGLSSEPKRIWGNRLVGCMIYENSITCLCSHAHLCDYVLLSYYPIIRGSEVTRVESTYSRHPNPYHPFSPRP